MELAVSIIAFFVYISSLLFKNKKDILLGQITYTFLTAVFYFMVNSLVMAYSQLLGTVRIYCARKFGANHYLFSFFILAGLGILLLTYKEPFNIVTFIGYTAFTFAGFYLDHIKMRLAFILGNLCMGAVALHNSGYMIVFSESIAFCLNVYAIIRIRKHLPAPAEQP